MKPAILLVDDESAIQFAFGRFLQNAGYEVTAAETLAAARALAATRRFDIVLLDLVLPDGSGQELIAELRQGSPAVAIVVVTGTGGVPAAVQAMQAGADNFLTKPVDLAELDVYMRKCLELRTLRRHEFARTRLAHPDQHYAGTSAAMQKALEFAELAAGKNTPVIIHGETGAGKGVLARWIHERSGREDGSFVEVNCSGLKGDLLGSELFGHARGAFTGAVQDKPGLLEVADGGTLFLDEVGDMDLGVQAQFLKAVEERQFRRLGEVKIRHSDFRLICATNHDLLQETRQGKFRLDLFYRINVFPIYLPALRDHVEDLEGLAGHFLKAMNVEPQRLSEDAWDLLRTYPWPGNIRELRNVLERAVLLGRGSVLGKSAFPGLLARRSEHPSHPGGGHQDERRQAIVEALAAHHNDTEAAALSLNISRATLYRRLQQHKIKIPK